MNETASISQAFSKPWTSPGTPGGAILAWDSAPVRITNVSLARFTVRVTDAGMSSRSWSADFTAAGPWTRRSLDLSSLLAPAGAYAISFSLAVAIDTYFDTNATVRIDNVTLLAPDYRSGRYTSKAFDAASPVVWGNVSWTGIVDPETGISVETRSGSSATPGDATWSPWLPHASSGEPIGSPNARRVQYRALLATTNGSRTPALLDLRLTFARFPAQGSVEAQQPFSPVETVVGWRRFTAVAIAPNETSVTYQVSSDAVLWSDVPSDGSLAGFVGGWIYVRAWLATANSSLSPRIASMAVTYEYVGSLAAATITPASWALTADETRPFAAQGYDAWGHPVAFTPTWETTDPTGSVTGGGLYRPGTAGVHLVRVRAPSGVILANATVTVTPGALVRLVVRASATSAPAGSLVSFTANGSDAHGNAVPLTSTAWSSTCGTFVNETAARAELRLPGRAGTATVTARQGTVENSTQVLVTSDGAPVIDGTVPDQVHPEDSYWDLDLSAYAGNQPEPANTYANLSWYLAGKDDSLYTVWGENSTGNHHLVFSTVPNAFGTNLATLWLRNVVGARTSQPLRITITPVNDPPTFETVPNLPVKAGLAYTFDVSPYIVDVDTPPSRLTLTTSDPVHVLVSGLNLTLLYPESDLGRTVYLRLAVSDGEYTAQTVTKVTVTSDAPPIVRLPLPDLTLREDEFLPRAFPKSLSEYFADPEGDDLFFSYGYRDINVSIWRNGTFWQVDVRPNPDWNGVERITFRATDGGGAFVEYSVLVTVIPVNDPPTFTWQGDLFVRFDTPYDLDLSPFIHDVDTPLSQVELAASPSRYAQVRGFTVTFLFPRFLLGPAPTYDVPVTFYVNDTGPGPTRQITVHVTNDAPPALRRGLPDVRFDEDTSYTAYRLSDYFFDPDSPGAALRYTFAGEQVTADIAADSMVTFRASPNWNGMETVRFRAEDAAGAYLVVPVDVRVIPVDDAPRWVRAIPDMDLTGGGTRVVDLRAYVEDVDTPLDRLNFTVEGDHAAVYGYMLVVDVPASATSGPVRVTVGDGTYTATTSFQVVITPPTLWDQIRWPWSGLGLLALAVVLALLWQTFFRYPRILEDVFVIGRDGRLILHNTRRLRADRDEDILAGMLTAIMAFVKDSFREETQDELEQFKIGDRRGLVEKGDHCYVAAIYAGEAPPWARKDLAAFLRDIEGTLGGRLANWSGDSDDLRGLKGMTADFVQRRRYGSGRPRPTQAHP